MKLATVAGAHACGKTAVILRTAELLRQQGLRIGIMKSDCVYSDDGELYERAGYPRRTLLAGNVCPDHHFATNLVEVCDWAAEQELDLLLTESAGLCGRCAPHLLGVPAVCVIDCLAGISAPKKAGPMLRCADFAVLTKGDLVSPAEREVFLFHVREANPIAKLAFINGLTGQGARRLAAFLLDAPETGSAEGRRLRSTMPSAECNYCAGQTTVARPFPGGRIKDRFPEEALL